MLVAPLAAGEAVEVAVVALLLLVPAATPLPEVSQKKIIINGSENHSNLLPYLFAFAAAYVEAEEGMVEDVEAEYERVEAEDGCLEAEWPLPPPPSSW